MKKIILPATLIGLMFLATGSARAAAPYIPTHVTLDLLGVIILLLTGVLIGIIGTLIGAGGGFIHVPVLILFYGFSPQHAIATSMTVVMLNAISGTFSYIAQKRIDYEIGIKYAAAAGPGVFIGALLSQFFNVTSFHVIFGILLIALSYYLFSGKEFSVVRTKVPQVPAMRYVEDAAGQKFSYAPDMSVGLASSSLIGVFSGLFGVGGGIFHVPLMYSVLGIPVHIATATSHCILAITSFLGVIVFAGLGFIDFDYAVVLGIGTILGAVWGARLSLTTNPRIIKKIIAFCLFLMALKLLLDVL
ncbi:MAG: sulfite exporter TauE/SafE family protein [Deltaproteobacteria bacterium]|nr:sulfite exporter TauE/SafE family protein [Deltaproteobacteria bacterium]